MAVNCGRNREEGVRVAAVAAAGVVFQADVSQESQVLAMLAAMQEAFEAVDILVNNAGIQKDAPFEEMMIEQWEQVLGVNLRGQFLCAREALRTFTRAGNPQGRFARCRQNRLHQPCA